MNDFGFAQGFAYCYQHDLHDNVSTKNFKRDLQLKFLEPACDVPDDIQII